MPIDPEVLDVVLKYTQLVSVSLAGSALRSGLPTLSMVGLVFRW
jgi:hypothetical protein